MTLLRGARIPTGDTPAASLAALRWLLPATGIFNATVWTCIPGAVSTANVSGETGASYDVTLRFRGVTELKTYVGVTNDGAYWQVGGAPAADVANVYKLTISSPAQTYYLNRGTTGDPPIAIDYVKTIQIDDGASVTLSADSIDAHELRHTISLPGVSDPPQPYMGQFVLMDVVSVVKRL